VKRPDARPRSDDILDAFLERAGLKLIDVGARGEPRGAFAFLAEHAELFAWEPDPDEAKRLEADLAERHAWRRVTVIPKAAGTRPGTATLYVTAKPGMSSLLPPNEEVVRRYPARRGFRVESRVEVPVVSLDAAAAEYGFTDACLAKLDTQGTELDILRSGEGLVRESLLGIYVEALFRPFYVGQSLFSDVDAYLRERGFVLMSLKRTQQRPFGYRKDFYSRRETLWAHCLYLRDPSWVASGTDLLRIHRYLAIALAHEHLDLVFELLGDDAAARALDQEYGPELVPAFEEHARRLTARTERRARPETPPRDRLERD
jgi:FkbM family methyltransferase